MRSKALWPLCCIFVVAAGCPSSDDSGDSCPSNRSCGDVCCAAGQSCVDGTCKAGPQCQTDQTPCGEICCAAGQICADGACKAPPQCSTGETACGEACCPEGQDCVEGTCQPAPQCEDWQTACGVACCDNATHDCVEGECVPSTATCDPACSDPTPECVGGVCKCNATSCGTGKKCNVDGACENVSGCDPECSGETPFCADHVCQCVTGSCEAGKTCSNGVCVTGPVCTPACTGTTPDCSAGNVCKCNSSSCGANESCENGVCVPTCTPACSGTKPNCVNGACQCITGSCGVGFECIAGACEAVCTPACSAQTPDCVNGHCECNASSCVNGTCTAGACVSNLPNGCGAGFAPTALTANASPLSGSTAGLTSSRYGDVLSDDCWYATGGYDGEGPELVYSYTPSASGAFVITVTPDSSYDTMLWVGPACGDEDTCVYAADNNGSGGREALAIDGIGGVTYYIHVDSYNAFESGSFTISVAPIVWCDPIDLTSCQTGSACYSENVGGVWTYICKPDGGLAIGVNCENSTDECIPGADCVGDSTGYYCRPFCDPAGVASLPACVAPLECYDWGDGGGNCMMPEY